MSARGFSSFERPKPYPEGKPCGIPGHRVWCRCEPPPEAGSATRYGVDTPEGRRIVALDKRYRREDRAAKLGEQFPTAKRSGR